MIRLRDILAENKKFSKMQYQIRDIGGPVFYCCKSAKDMWQFISAEEFAAGLTAGGKLIEYKIKD